MGKIGIYSLHGYGNFGNKLQNYAVEQLVTLNGFEPVSLILRAHPMRACLRDAATVGKGLLGAPRDKTKRFLRFDSERLHNVRPLSQNRLQELGHSSEFSAFIAGSDQVWYCEDVEPTSDKCAFYSNRFLQFAPMHKRVALAPSFGMDEIPEQWRTFYADALRSIPSLSVREKSGSELVERLVGTKPVVVADPTLGFDREFWGALADSCDGPQPENRYVLSFFLGPVAPEVRSRLLVEASSLGACVVGACGDDGYLTSAGPEDFLRLIRDADCVFTDSFHCVVFSLIFHKEFYVSRRVGSPTMFGRITTLLDGMDLESRVLGASREAPAPSVDWKLVDSIISKRRNCLRDYISKALLGAGTSV